MTHLFQGSRIRLHWLVASLMALCLIALSALVAGLTQVRLHASAQETARTLFNQVAERNALKMQNVLTTTGNAVQFLAAMPLTSVDGAGRIDRPRLTALLLAAVQAQPQVYSVYVGFGNDDMLQVIGVRNQPRLAESLKTPQGTHFAVRTIERSAAHAGALMESWVYLDARSVRIGERGAKATDFAPTRRPWFQQALGSSGLQLTPAYEMSSSHELGMSLAQLLSQGGGVVAADLVFAEFDQFAQASLDGHEGGVMLSSEDGVLLARYAGPEFSVPPVTRLESLARSSNDFVAAAAALDAQESSRIETVRGQEMVYARSPVYATPSQRMWVTAFAPVARFVAPLRVVQHELLWVTLCGLLLILLLGYALSRWLGRSLDGLVQQSQRIQDGDFSGDEVQRSPIQEVDVLYRAQHAMKLAIRERSLALDEAMRQLSCLVDSGKQLSRYRTAREVAQQCVDSACALVGARSAQLWRRESDGLLRLVADSGYPDLPATAWDDAPRIAGDNGAPDDKALMDPCTAVARSRRPWFYTRGQLPEIDLGHQAEAAQWLQAQDPARAPTPHAAPDTLLAVPVLVGHEKLDGVLVLLDPRGGPSGRGGGQDALHGVQSLAAQAGIVFENLALEQAQEDFMEALLKLLAGAIDAKSSYTGGHCARVPELARMLAEAASATRSGPLADFHFSTAQQWREFHIGTWLHDCGKVTTPEHVMDKATKLETVYNRIHEVRMRFEVLLRDAQIACLQEQQGGADAALAESRCAARVAELQADFAFVAECNIGGEVMAPERVQRLEQIAAQFWWRHFDDRLGLSHGERDHLTGFAPRPLPVREQLLADKPEHVVPRPPMDLQEHRYRFAMDVPEALYHYGELHNLRVQRGTLTPEDRFKINEHVIQTIVMLEQLPLPEDLKRIPEYAGTHHETLTGTGYPRRLDASQLSVPARIMAVADIFEALTAGDRPYKPAKTLSESLALLNRFKRDRHIDADVFDLFLTSGVYLEYARRFMKPEQMDAVDIAQYLG